MTNVGISVAAERTHACSSVSTKSANWWMSALWHFPTFPAVSRSALPLKRTMATRLYRFAGRVRARLIAGLIATQTIGLTFVTDWRGCSNWDTPSWAASKICNRQRRSV